ncbi:hypothetical protein [Clostridium fallax]|uniref:WD40-like Beta Propeller Repeat n=1 Tax=Clostridium fallax TaxID=1533 RepID=A0A1M4ZGR6_9CLOT|nr:hypothetical protein [Clostridium fallax]SHF16992.1 hypothetical protein SAMN05443638_1466 [Clostridium fallax]SQB06386.1 dipeptidyl peptidase IV [Clostridium fallax]
MKKFKMVFCWALLSVVFQCSIFFILSNYYFKTNTDVDIKQIEIKEDTTYKDCNINLPQNSKNKSLSYNGEYIAFLENDKLKVLNTTNSNDENLNLDNNFKVSCFKWLNDRNRLIAIGKKDNEIILHTIDLNNIKNSKELNVSDNMKDLSTKTRHSINIDDFAISTKTSVMYLKAIDKSSNCYIYRINSSDEFEKIKPNTNKISDIEIIPREDRLIYETLDKSEFYITRPDKKIYIKGNGKYNLLQIDENSNLYVGNLVNDKINKIFVKKLDSNSPSIDTINLDIPINSKDIYITIDGQTLLNYKESKTLKDITVNKEYKYNGNIISVYKEGFSTISEDNRLTKYRFKN